MIYALFVENTWMFFLDMFKQYALHPNEYQKKMEIILPKLLSFCYKDFKIGIFSTHKQIMCFL